MTYGVLRESMYNCIDVHGLTFRLTGRVVQTLKMRVNKLMKTQLALFH